LLDLLRNEGVGGIAFSPLAQGLLSDRYLEGIPSGSRASKPHGFLKPAQVDQRRVGQASDLEEVARGRGQSLAQMALAWVLRDTTVTSALIGASSPDQVELNVKALANLDFTEEENRLIEEILR